MDCRFERVVDISMPRLDSAVIHAAFWIQRRVHRYWVSSGTPRLPDRRNSHCVATATDEHTYDGIVFDLGYSSWHVDESGKGFSFRKDEPLDMRYNPKETSETAGDIINTWNEEELFHIFATFGEERTSASRRIARAIVQARKGGRNKIRTTGELVGIIEQEVAHRKHKIHPATLIFQALRIVVNDELGTLQRTLPQTLDVIKPGGKIAIISFHSLEDRIVKRFFAYFDTTQLWVMTKRPITPTGREIETNPRA